MEDNTPVFSETSAINSADVTVYAKASTLLKILRYLMIVAAVCFLVYAFMFISIFALVLGAACCLLVYLLNHFSTVDYDYELVDSDLYLAKVLNKDSRRELGKFDMKSLEILAPQKSHELDSYRSRRDRVIDVSSHRKDDPDIYWAELEGGTRIILTLKEQDAGEMIALIRRFGPRKVFRN